MKNKNNSDQMITIDQAAIVSESVKQAEALIDKKLRHLNNLMMGVIIVLAIAFVAIIIDQLHFNNQTYREFSDLRMENIESIKRISELEHKMESQKLQCIIEQQNRAKKQ